MVSWNASGHNCCVGLVDQLSASLAGDIIHPYKHKPTFSLSCSLACWFSLVFLVNARAAVHRCPQLWTAERTHTYKQAHTKAKRSPRTVVHSWCSVLAGQVQEIQLQGSDGWEWWSSPSPNYTPALFLPLSLCSLSFAISLSQMLSNRDLFRLLSLPCCQ